MKFVADVKAGGFFERRTPELLVVVGLLVIGVVLRIWQYAANRSLWLDECSLALNLIHRSFAGLTQPLDYNLAAPLLFLFIQKTNIIVMGHSEFALRLFPLLAGILSLFLMYKTAKVYLQGTAAYIALALFCLSSALIYYSSENKQYSSDVMCALILLLAAYPCLQENPKPQNYMLLMAAGLAAMWLSHPSLFVLTGIGFAVTARQVFRKNWYGLSWAGSAFLIWMVNLAVLYITSLRSTAANNNLIAYWIDNFMPMPPWDNWGWFSTTLESIFRNPMGLSLITVSAVLLSIGLMSLLQRKWDIGIVLILTIMTTLVASGLQKYPFRGRLVLFLVPIIFLLIAEGIERIRSELANCNRYVASFTAAALALLLLAHPIVSAINGLQKPNMREHIRPVLEYVSQNKRSTDIIYVYYGAKFAFKYYAVFYGFTDSDYRVGVRARKEPGRYLKDIDTLKGSARVWFIFAHNYNWSKIDEKMHYLNYLNRIGKKVDEFIAPGAAVYLYDLRSSSISRRYYNRRLKASKNCNISG